MKWAGRNETNFTFWVERKDPDDAYLSDVIFKLFEEDPYQFPPGIVDAIASGEVRITRDWIDKKQQTFIVLHSQ